jgi:triacylglycerol lipase
MRALVVTAALAALASVLACENPGSEADQCAEIKHALASCVGDVAERLDCRQTSAVDLARLGAVAQGPGCNLLASSLPLDGDPLSATCRMLGVGCVAPVTPAPVRHATRYPVVLVNGIDNSPLFRWSDRIVRTLREAGGHRVFLATLPAWEPPVRRAPDLAKRIDAILAETGAKKVNLVCHSLGGFDCRYLASPRGLAADLGRAPDAFSAKVASITTVGTAHRGTPVADVLLGLAPGGDRGKLVDDFAGLVSDAFSAEAIDRDVNVREALRALSVTAARAFDAEIADAPGVYAQSYAGVSRPFGEASAEHDARLAELCRTSEGQDGLADFRRHDYLPLTLLPIADVAGSARDGAPAEPNDGLVPVASTHWGVFRGCVAADHMEQLGQKNLPDVNVRTGFDVARFYAGVASDLAERGF